jgi:hypothetical protein
LEIDGRRVGVAEPEHAAEGVHFDRRGVDPAAPRAEILVRAREELVPFPVGPRLVAKLDAERLRIILGAERLPAGDVVAFLEPERRALAPARRVASRTPSMSSFCEPALWNR